jgi:hypothetical protein
MSKDKRLTAKEMLERDTMAIMGDEDSVTGFLIAGWFIFCSNSPRHYSVPAVRFTTCLEASKSSNF